MKYDDDDDGVFVFVCCYHVPCRHCSLQIGTQLLLSAVLAQPRQQSSSTRVFSTDYKYSTKDQKIYFFSLFFCHSTLPPPCHDATAQPKSRTGKKKDRRLVFTTSDLKRGYSLLNIFFLRAPTLFLPYRFQTGIDYSCNIMKKRGDTKEVRTHTHTRLLLLPKS